MALWLFASVLLGTRLTTWKSMEMNTVKLALRSRHMRQRQTRWTWLHNTLLHCRDPHFEDNTYKTAHYRAALSRETQENSASIGSSKHFLKPEFSTPIHDDRGASQEDSTFVRTTTKVQLLFVQMTRKPLFSPQNCSGSHQLLNHKHLHFKIGTGQRANEAQLKVNNLRAITIITWLLGRLVCMNYQGVIRLWLGLRNKKEFAKDDNKYGQKTPGKTLPTTSVLLGCSVSWIKLAFCLNPQKLQERKAHFGDFLRCFQIKL